MRKLTGTLCLLGILSVPAHAADVAVLDWREALMNSEAAQRSLNELRNQTSSQRQQAEALGQELQQLQQRLQQNGDVMSDAERSRAQQELRQKGSQFQQARGQLQQLQQQKEQQFLKTAKPELDRAIEQVVSRHNVQVLIDRDAVVYTQDSLDLTEEVTQILNSN